MTRQHQIDQWLSRVARGQYASCMVVYRDLDGWRMWDQELEEWG